MKFIRHFWLTFCQAVTVLLAIIFVIRFYVPDFPNSLFLKNTPTGLIQQAKPSLTQSKQTISTSTFSSAASTAMPAVVNVFTSIKPRNRNGLLNDPLLRFFFGDQFDQFDRYQKPQTSLGSGVIVSNTGLILTNHHVVAEADTIEVALSDGRKLSATRVGSDPETDLSLLKIDAKNLPIITFSNQSDLAIGDIVLAIGNPFGVGQTVTQGIVSALGRDQLGINHNTLVDFIQTDASINPGNSGGALVNIKGQLVGINTAIYSKSGGSMGIGFAIPANLAKEVVDQLVQDGKVIRGWIGVETQDLTPALAESFGLEIAKGAIITALYRDGPAHQAGLQPGDIIIQVNDKNAGDSDAVMNVVTRLKPEARATFMILRNGEVLEREITIGSKPAQLN